MTGGTIETLNRGANPVNADLTPTVAGNPDAGVQEVALVADQAVAPAGSNPSGVSAGGVSAGSASAGSASAGNASAGSAFAGSAFAGASAHSAHSADSVRPAVPADEPGGPGRQLGILRQQAGLSIEQVVAVLRFNARQIEALEQDDLARLPPRAQLRGMIRNYAKLLKLDPEPFLAQVPSHSEPATGKLMTEFMEVPFRPGNGSRYSMWWALGILIALAVVAYWGADRVSRVREEEKAQSLAAPADPRGVQAEASSDAAAPPAPDASAASEATPAGASESQNPPPAQANQTTSATQGTATQAIQVAAATQAAPATAATQATPATTATQASSAVSATQTVPSTAATQAASATAAPQAPSASAASSSARVLLSFQRASWVEIRDDSGRVVVSETFPGNSQKTLELRPPLKLTIGAASGVQLEYRGKQVDLAPSTRLDIARLTLE